MKFELLTDVACFAYIAGKKNTKENKKDNAIQKTLKTIECIDLSFLMANNLATIMVKE